MWSFFMVFKKLLALKHIQIRVCVFNCWVNAYLLFQIGYTLCIYVVELGYRILCS